MWKASEQPVVKVDHRLLVVTKPEIRNHGMQKSQGNPQGCSSALQGFVYWQAVPTFTTACQADCRAYFLYATLPPTIV
jgi:hypothetical protein